MPYSMLMSATSRLTSHVRDTGRKMRNGAQLAFSAGGARAAGREWARYQAGQTAGDQLVNVMLVITVAAAIGFVGTKVISEIDSSISVTQGSDFDHAIDNISGGYADAMGLSDIVFIVLMFGVILVVLSQCRGQT